MSIHAYRQKLELYLQEKEARGEPLPGLRGRVNYKGIAIETEIPYTQFEKGCELRLLVDAWLAKLGVANNSLTEQPRRTLKSKDFSPLITYGDLKAGGLLRLKEEVYAKATIASYQSHLNAFMRLFGRTNESSTAEDFGAHFESRVNAFMKAPGASEAGRSALNLFATIHHQLHQSTGLPSNFAAALTELVIKSGRTQIDIARVAGIKNPEYIGNWMRGDKAPWRPEQVTRLEEVFDVVPGTLSATIVFRKGHRTKSIPEDWWPEPWQASYSNSRYLRYKVIGLIPQHLLTRPPDVLKPVFDDIVQKVMKGEDDLKYRQRLAKFRTKVYYLHYTNWPSHLKAEFSALEAYKTAPDDFDNTSRGGSWAEETVKIARTKLESFFGFLCLPADHPDPELRGMGLHPESLTLAWLAVPKIIKRFLNFHRLRSEGFNSATETFITGWSSLLQPGSGWLWLHPELLERLPEQHRQEVDAAGGWETYYAQVRTDLNGSLAKLKRRGQIKQTRNPMLPVWPILDHREPLSLVIAALNLTRQDLRAQARPNEMFTHQLAVAWRDYLLIRFLARFPLRAKHWGLFTYKEDGSGYLQRHSRNDWRLVIPYEDFKNEANLSIFTFHMEEERFLTLKFSDLKPLKRLIPSLEFYLKNAHPILAGKGNFLFPTTSGGPMSTNNIYTRVNLWTLEYLSQYSSRQTAIKGVFPFGPHAFRDIVATHFIKTTGDIALTADILLDSEETVRKHYARFLPEDRIGLAMARLAGAFETEEDEEEEG